MPALFESPFGTSICFPRQWTTPSASPSHSGGMIDGLDEALRVLSMRENGEINDWLDVAGKREGTTLLYFRLYAYSYVARAVTSEMCSQIIIGRTRICYRQLLLDREIGT